MIVYVCRHASAGPRRENARRDELRPLDARGQQQARHMGTALAMLGIGLNVILSSPLKRATQTAALIASELGYQGRWELEAALRPEADFSGFRAMLARYSGYEAVLVVGHKPSLPASLGRLLGAQRAVVELKKGAIAKIEVDGQRTRLVWLLTPSLVQQLQSRTIAKSKPKTARK